MNNYFNLGFDFEQATELYLKLGSALTVLEDARAAAGVGELHCSQCGSETIALWGAGTCQGCATEAAVSEIPASEVAS